MSEGNQRRGELVALYRQKLAQAAPHISVPFTQARGQSSYHIMPVLLPKGADKLAFMAVMKEAGIQTSWHYPPVHSFSTYAKGWTQHSIPLPLTEAVAAREVTLLLYPTMTEEQVDWVVEAIIAKS